MSIKLGDKVTDTISGLEGTATAIVHYLNDSTDVMITGQIVDGRVPTIWVNINRVELA